MKITVAPRQWSATIDQNGRVKLTTLGTQGPPGPPGDKATQAEAEAGTDDAAYMTPLKTAQAVAAAPVGAATQSALDAETQARTAADTAEATARAAGDALKVAKAGDTMTGSLRASGGLADLGDATNQWRDLYLVGAVKAATTIQLSGSFIRTSAAALTIGQGNISQLGFTPAGVGLRSDQPLGFSSTTNPASAFDTGLSRGAAGQVNVGNGTAGDASGTLKAATVNAATFANPSGITVVGAASSGVTLTGGARDNASPTVGFGWQAGVIAARSTGLIGFTSATNNATSLPDTAFSRISGGVAALGTGAQGNAGGTLKLAAIVAGPFTVATLPSAAATPVGAQTAVSDCANPTAIGSAVAGGGSALKGVINTGTTWLVD